MDSHRKIPGSFVRDGQYVAHIDSIRIGENRAEMEGLYPDTEGVLGAA